LRSKKGVTQKRIHNFQLIELARLTFNNRPDPAGLEEQGLYRVVGVASKVNKLLTMGLDKRKVDKLNLSDRYEWESKTITSALKTYLRTLPLMTYRYYNSFITAASAYRYS
jgi:hypothetical protein